MFNTVPYNSFPASSELLQKLDAVAKAIDDMPTYTSNDRAFLDTWEVDLPILQEDVNDLNEQKANQITIAPFFNSETAYEIGDLVYYNGLTYRCTNAHEGEWDADDFTGTTISNELDTLKSGLTNMIINQITEVTFDENGVGTFTIPEGYYPLVACLDESWITTIHYNDGHYYVTAHSTINPTTFINSTTVTYYWFLFFGESTN